jgi:hypothetical protein
MLPEGRPMRELSGLTPGDLGSESSSELLTAGEPCVLRGLASNWPMVGAARQSQDAASRYLCRFYRGQPVVAYLAPPEIEGRFGYNGDMSGFNFSALQVRLDRFLEELDDHKDDVRPPAAYVGSTGVDSHLPGFRAENDLDLGARDPLVSIWVGNRTRISAHYDLPDNIAVVAAGRRRFTLFPPEQVSNLYVGPLDFTPAGQAISLVDFANPDLERFPRFVEAMRHARVAELEPGDAIFIPSMWWHHIEALAPFNLLVNYWWRQSPGFMESPSTTLMHALLTLRGLPPAQREAWRALFDHYVFDSDGSEAAHIPEGAARAGPVRRSGGARAARPAGQTLQPLMTMRGRRLRPRPGCPAATRARAARARPPGTA